MRVPRSAWSCPSFQIHVAEHMPSAHRRPGEWTPARMLAQATKTGPGVAAFCEMVLADRRSSGQRSTGALPDPPHPEQGFRTCLGVLSLVKTHGPARVDAACQRGVTIRARP